MRRGSVLQPYAMAVRAAGLCVLLGACASAPPPGGAMSFAETPDAPALTDEDIPAGEPPVDEADDTPADAAEAAPSTPPPATGENPPRRGLRALFARKPTPPSPPVEAPEAPPPVADPETAADPVPSNAAPSRRSGLLGLLGKRTPDGRADDNGIVGPVPFGQLARDCDVTRRAMGPEVARANAYALHDTDPTATGPRDQYLTGFADGCARRFTAALALFGSAQVHEATRYVEDNDTPYSETDRAYEKIKNRVCGVKNGQVCPIDRAPRLDKDTAFVTVYPDFGGAGEWLEIFLHKGEVAATSTRTR